MTLLYGFCSPDTSPKRYAFEAQSCYTVSLRGEESPVSFVNDMCHFEYPVSSGFSSGVSAGQTTARRVHFEGLALQIFTPKFQILKLVRANLKH